MGERTCTGWATDELGRKLSGLALGDGVATSDLSGGWVSGEVSIAERKGKNFPIYSLEVELPFEGTVGGKSVKGTARLPDISIEMLDDLEVVLAADDGSDLSALAMGADALKAAVREWALGVRKAVSDNAAAIPLDPPAQTRTPRAAALISEEEAMSAGGAGELDDADIENIPHPDDEEEGEEDEEPFTEEEVGKMYEEAKAMLMEAVDESEVDEQLKELDAELAGRDVQERGRILVDVINYLERGEEGEEGEEELGEEEEGDEEGGGGDDEPYPGADGLEKLWNEVVEICAEEDLPRLEAEVKDKQPQEQWKILLEVRDFLVNGDAEERAAFEEWNPTVRELDDEWAGLMARVSPEEAEELAPDYAKATAEEKKRFVWDARNFLEEQEGEEEGDDGAGPPPAKAPPPRPPTDAELGGRNEGPTRRRGARGAHMEYGFDEEGVDRGDWDEFYKKEVKGSKKGSNTMLYGGACVLISLLTIVLTATAMADEEESILQSSLRLLRIG